MEGAERCCVIVGRLFLVHSKVSNNMRMSVCLHVCACTHTSMSIVWFSCNLSLRIHPSYKYLLCTSFVPGTALGLKNIAIDKSEKSFCLRGVYIQWGLKIDSFKLLIIQFLIWSSKQIVSCRVSLSACVFICHHIPCIGGVSCGVSGAS